jgi:hypothetical protein
MMNKLNLRSMKAAGSFVFFAMISALAMANSVVNGDVEAGLAGWKVTEELGSSVVPSASAQSPFSSGAQGLAFTDASEPGNPGTPNAFVAVGIAKDGQYRLSFDYCMQSIQVGTWTLRVYNNGVNSASFACTFGGSTFQLNGFAAKLLAKNLAPMTWYHVEMTLDTVNKKFINASITPHGGTATTVAEWAGYDVTASGIKSIAVVDVSPTTVASPIYLDNVTIVEVQ